MKSILKTFIFIRVYTSICKLECVFGEIIINTDATSYSLKSIVPDMSKPEVVYAGKIKEKKGTILYRSLVFNWS